MKELNILVNKSSSTLEEEIKLTKLKDDFDNLYTNMTDRLLYAPELNG